MTQITSKGDWFFTALAFVVCWYTALEFSGVISVQESFGVKAFLAAVGVAFFMSAWQQFHRMRKPGPFLVSAWVPCVVIFSTVALQALV